MNPLSFVRSDVAVGTAISIVTLDAAFAVKVPTEVLFFVMVSVASLTVGNEDDVMNPLSFVRSDVLVGTEPAAAYVDALY